MSIGALAFCLGLGWLITSVILVCRVIYLSGELKDEREWHHKTKIWATKLSTIKRLHEED